MAYRLRCNACRQTFTASYRTSPCPHCRADRDYGSTLLEDVVDIAVDVAVAYVAADIVSDVAGAVLGSIFDW
jgi:rRNA maturation endonuclease Nob1